METFWFIFTAIIVLNFLKGMISVLSDSSSTGSNGRGITDWGTRGTSGSLGCEYDDFAVNPATGLPMIGGTGGVDVHGNPFGSDIHEHNWHNDHTSSSGMNSFSSGSFDSDSFSISGSGFNDW